VYIAKAKLVPAFGSALVSALVSAFVCDFKAEILCFQCLAICPGAYVHNWDDFNSGIEIRGCEFYRALMLGPQTVSHGAK
jgi:hypothetical protein